MVNTPVLFETFVRVDYARQVWDAIKAAQPKKLYFYSNKGRAEKEGEIERNNEIRSWVKEIDWDCELHTWFREECVDVYTSLSGAISWLFENEETGIILEDDCVPTKAFFDFCEKMLKRFESISNVWFVSGDNFIEDYGPKDYDYFFSRHKWMYGWATWKSRWSSINWDPVFLEKAINSDAYNKIMPTKLQSKLYNYFILKYNRKKIVENKCWDYVFGINIDCNSGVGVYPSRNLISNIGISGEHTQNKGKMPLIYRKSIENREDYAITRPYPYIFPIDKYEGKMFYEIFIRPNLSIKRMVKILYRTIAQILNR